jgi:hypothetical protein
VYALTVVGDSFQEKTMTSTAFPGSATASSAALSSSAWHILDETRGAAGGDMFEGAFDVGDSGQA